MRSGHSILGTSWRDRQALAGSRSAAAAAAAAMRVDTVLATDGVIRGAEEYKMVFSPARRF